MPVCDITCTFDLIVCITGCMTGCLQVPEELMLASSDKGSPGWSSIPMATKTMLLMVAFVMRSRFMHQDGHSIDTCMHLAVHDLSLKIEKICSQQHTSTQSMTDRNKPCSGLLRVIRSVFLLTKAARSVTSAKMQASSAAIWSAAAISSGDIAKLNSKISRQTSEEEDTELQTLTRLIVQSVIPTMKQLMMVKSSSASTVLECCCTIMLCLLIDGNQAVRYNAAVEISETGKRCRGVCRTCQPTGSDLI